MKILKTLFSVKKLALALVALVLTLTLVACNGQTGTPYGSINNDTYLEANGYTVSQKQLYDQLRLSSVNRLTTYIDELMFADVAIDAAKPFEVTAFEQEINTALFSSATITAKQISQMSERNIAQMILSYADSFAITNPNADKVEIANLLDAVIKNVIADDENPNFDTTDYVFGYTDKVKYPTYASAIDAILSQYKLNVQKKVNAKNNLGDLVNGEFTGDLANEDSSVYVKESDVVAQYKNNIAGKYTTTPLILSFESTKENELARYKFAIKSNSLGEWYSIPNLDDSAEIGKVLAATPGNTTVYAKVAQMIEDNKISGITRNELADLHANGKTISFDSPAFASYYSNYTFSTGLDIALENSANNNQVLNVFLAIYDFLNGTEFAIDASAGNLEALAPGTPHRKAIEAALTLKYTAAIFTANTSLRSHVYGLNSEKLHFEDDTTAKPYSRQVQTLGNGTYLVYLLDDARDTDKDVLDETGDEVVFADTPNGKLQKEAAQKELVKSRFTAAYITSQTTKKYEDAKINIYDPILRDIYANQAEYTGSKGFKDNDTLADVNGTVITVDGYYDYIVDTLGFSTALDLIFVKNLEELYGDQITEEMKKEYRKNLEDIIKSFQAGGFESSGFPASLGIDKFLLLAVGAYAHDGISATADAINKLYINSKLRELFQADLTAHYGDKTEANNIYTKFAKLAEVQRDNQVELAASHLLIYVDFNNDGTNDVPTDSLIAAQGFKDITTLAEFEAKVSELINILKERIKKYPTYALGLQGVVAEYTESTRFSKFNNETEYLDYLETLTTAELLEYFKNASISDIFGQFKRLGIKVMQESLGTISNQTNFPGGESSLDVKFFDYAMDLGNFIKAQITADSSINVNTILPVFATEVTTGDAAFSVEKTRSSFGWHLILVTGYTTPLSAKQTAAESEVENPFVSGAKLNAENTTDNLNWKQILIYIEESKEYEGDVITLPTSVQNAYAKYFTPIYTLYTTSTYVQLELAFDLIFEGVTLNPAQTAQLSTLRQANLNQFFSYSYFANAATNSLEARALNPEYAAVYGQWFNILNA